MVSATLTAVLLTTMEVADVRRATSADDNVDDRATTVCFGAAMGAAITASAFSFAARDHPPVPRRPRRWWVGIALIWSGAAVNRLARRELGNNYRSQLTIVDRHEVIDSGPYRLVRHPMYSGATLICIGCGLAVDASPFSLAWALPAAALVHRVQVEEQLLGAALGRRYEDFADRRARLVPGVW